MSISIFDKKTWANLLPKELTVVTNNGKFTLKLPEQNGSEHMVVPDSGPSTAVTVISDEIQISYSQNTMEEFGGSPTKDGEPDTLEFDIHTVKTNDGTQANPDNLKLNVNITYGDAPVSKFTISMPGETEVVHYQGFGSKYDPTTSFGFEDESLQALIDFFNRFGFKLDKDDFTFLDKHPDSYTYTEGVKIMPSFNGDVVLVINNAKPQENRFLTNVLNYLKMRGVDYVVASNPEEVKKNNNDKVIGAISTGSEYRLSNPESDSECAASTEALNTLKCPVLGMCYGMQHMGTENGANLATLDKAYNDKSILSEYDKQHFLFNGLDLSDTQASFDFNDYLEDCPQGFKTIAKLDDKIAGISNDEKKHFGLLFHPEDIEDTYGILDNFIGLCQQGKNKNDEQTIDQSKNDMKYIQTYESFRKKRNK
jgi:GMP synthase-like glutamine amidotransferase